MKDSGKIIISLIVACAFNACQPEGNPSEQEVITVAPSEGRFLGPNASFTVVDNKILDFRYNMECTWYSGNTTITIWREISESSIALQNNSFELTGGEYYYNHGDYRLLNYKLYGYFDSCENLFGIYSIEDKCSVTWSAALQPTTVWKDVETGYTWQKNAPTDRISSLQEATEYCQTLGDKWRVPTMSEIRTLIHGCPATEPGGSCNFDDDCIEYEDCWDWLGPCAFACGDSAGMGPANGCFWPNELEGVCWYYWSSTRDHGWRDRAWGVNFFTGQLEEGHGQMRVRCIQSE